MARGLSDEEIVEIIESYEDTESIDKTSDATGRSNSTVSKYVNQWKDGEIEVVEGEIVEGDPTDSTPEGFTAQPPEGTPAASGEDDLSSMDHGEFIRWFFDQDGFGVYESFSNTLAKKCEVREKIPDRAEMANELMTGKSGISNGHQAESVAEVYWDAAQRFLQAKGEPMPVGQSSVGLGGSWQSGSNEGQGEGAAGGSWVGPGQQGGQQGQQQSRTNGGWTQGQQPGHPPQGAPRGQPPQQGGASQQLIEVMNELKETQAHILRHLNDQRSPQQEVKTVQERMQELVQLQNTIDQMGGDGQDDAVEALQGEIQQIREEVARQQQQDGGGPVQVDGGDGGFALVAQLAARDDVDTETLSVLADAAGVTDPEVKKAEFELERTEKQLESRKELVNTVFDNVGDVSGDLVGALMDALSNGEEEPQEADAQGEQQTDADDGGVRTVEPASPSAQTGDIQVVGGGQGGGGDRLESAAERRARQRREAGGTEGFQSPGEGVDGPSDVAEPEVAESCQWVMPSGDRCGADVVEGQTLCDDHLDQSERDPTGDYQ